MSTSNVFFKGCFSELTEEQKDAVEDINNLHSPSPPVEGEVVDRSCGRETNDCGISLEELIDTYEFYEFQKGVYKSWGGVHFPWEIKESTANLNLAETIDKWSVSKYREVVAYFTGDRVLYIEDDGYIISLYEANEDILALSPPLDRTKWTKICSVEVSEPAQLPTVDELVERYDPYFLKLYLEDWGEASSSWNKDLSSPSDDSWNNYKEKREYYYVPGDFVILESECSDAFCLWINIKEIPTSDYYTNAHAEFPYFDPVKDENGIEHLYWDKLYCVNSGKNKCLGPQRKRDLPNYQLVEIGSQGHYVEQPIPFYDLEGNKLCNNYETLNDAATLRPRTILTDDEISNL